tara:strand:- start:238 stop:501 length:264 start_codon:yes stop_codon:yes gene_type:complete
MDKFVIILGLVVTILISLAVFIADYYENKKYCGNEKGFFHRAYDYLGIKKTESANTVNKMDNSFTVPVDERPKLMYENGSDYYWSWQ